MLERPPKRRIIDRTGLIIGLGVGLFGLVLFASGVVGPLLQVYEASDWTPNTCRVVRADVSRHVDSDDVSFSMDLRYRFEHAGRPYWGTRLDFVGDRSASTQGALHERFPVVGARVPCWFDPSDPRRSVLRRDGWTGWRVVPPLFMLVLALGFSSGSVRRAPRQRILRDGRLRITRRNASTVELVILAMFPPAFTFSGIAAMGQGAWPGALFLVVGLGMLAWVAYKVLGFLTVVTVVLDRADLRPGQPIGVAWTARAPFRTIEPTATLIGREQCAWTEGSNPRIDLHAFHERHLLQDTAHDIPRDVPPSIAEGDNRIEWLIQVRAHVRGWPDIDIEVPILVRGALASEDADAAPIPPRPPPSKAQLSIHLDDGRATFAPGQTIGATITWNLDRAPRRATLSLTWTSVSERSTHHEVAGTVDLGVLPRLVETGSADPYRGAMIHEEARAPLDACERRRLRIVAPDAPYTHDGALFQVEWKLGVKLEPEGLADPVAIALVIDGRRPDHEPPPRAPTGEAARRKSGKRNKRGRR